VRRGSTWDEGEVKNTQNGWYEAVCMWNGNKGVRWLRHEPHKLETIRTARGTNWKRELERADVRVIQLVNKKTKAIST